ncbi:MAG: PAS domain-containing protein [Alphaproteobacteria bacterium]
MDVVEQSAASIIRSRGRDLGQLATLYRDNDLQPPVVTLAPGAEDIPLPTHRTLWTWWIDKGGPEHLPPFDLISPATLKPFLGRLIVLEPIDDGADFRYRLYGSTIAQFVGMDFTGKLLSQTHALRRIPEVMIPCHLATFRAAIQARQALYMAEQREHAVTPYTWHRLLLPFAAADGSVGRVLLYTVPCEADGNPLPAWRVSED